MADSAAAGWPAADAETALMRALALLLLLSACGSPERDAAVNETDPAITDAVNDPILADPRLALQERGSAIGVPTGVEAGIAAKTLGQVATARVAEPAFAGCNAKIDYAFAWSARLPADLPLPAKANVTEAAGSDAENCKLRLVRFVTTQSPEDVTDAYRATARKAAYVVTDSDGGFSAIRNKDGAAIAVTTEATTNGARVDFITNRGS